MSAEISHAQTQPRDASQSLMHFDFFSDARGMHLSPGILEKLEGARGGLEGTQLDKKLLNILLQRWGIQQVNSELVGIKSVQVGNLKVGVLGCVACHSGKAAGIHIVGIGNKNIDPGQIGRDGVLIESQYKKITDRLVRLKLKEKSPLQLELERNSILLMKKLDDRRMKAHTQGLVPVSLVGSWFYEQSNAPAPDHGYLGAVKVPSWFGFKEKMNVGQFADGIGKGHPPGWIIGVEITSGQTANGVRKYQHKIQEAVELISELKPPKYPYPIQMSLAQGGKKIFENTCSKCHGTYESKPDGSPLYAEPKLIPLDKVGTDPDRLDYVTPDFMARVRMSPLSDLIQLSEHAGQRKYFAPRLHGIWARFPYLHNASVPTLRDLLEPAARRPKTFSLRDAGEAHRFDQERVGLTMPLKPSQVQEFKRDHKQKRRWIYDTQLKGQSNEGHEKGTQLTPAEKSALVEYLKTL